MKTPAIITLTLLPMLVNPCPSVDEMAENTHDLCSGMRFTSESNGIEDLRVVRSAFAREVRSSFEHKAKPCSTCETPGICCTDEHFVNVRITRLEAAAISIRLDELDEKKRDDVYIRARSATERYELAELDDPAGKTYACPLFERGVGCLVHDSAKPLPCIAHACYENKADLPPDELLESYQAKVGGLNRRVYGRDSIPIPIPIAILRDAKRETSLTRRPQPSADHCYRDQEDQEDRVIPKRHIVPRITLDKDADEQQQQP